MGTDARLHLVAVPPLILELGGARVERKLAAAAHEVPGLGKELAILALAVTSSIHGDNIRNY